MLRRILILLSILLAIVLTYRLVRPLQIFVISPEFELPVDTGPIPSGLVSLSAKSCGRCHAEIYKDWSTSMHANAWTDPYFQADYAFDGSLQICLNCHTPLRDQQEHLVLGFTDASKFYPILKPNPAYDRSLQNEGVTCAACHVRDGVIHGPNENNRAPHPVKRDETMSDGHSVCRRCHMVKGERWDTFYRFPPCGTFDETKEAGKAPQCTMCHMPEMEEGMVPAVEGKTVRRHLWRGGHDPEMVKRALKLELHPTGKGAPPMEYSLILTNVGANHRVPTGTPDRHLTVTFRLLDADLKGIKEKSYRMKRTIMWRPVIADLWDTRLKPGEARTFSFVIKENTGAAFLEVEVRYHLLDERRRKRIGYNNKEPIDYSLYYRRIELDPRSGN